VGKVKDTIILTCAYLNLTLTPRRRLNLLRAEFHARTPPKVWFSVSAPVGLRWRFEVAQNVVFAGSSAKLSTWPIDEPLSDEHVFWIR
jgi:hypothetical protein